MKVLLTGGSGFIGNHLSDFLKMNHKVSMLDISPPHLKDIEFRKGDITSPADVTKAVMGTDVVIHLAAMVGVVNSDSEPIKTLDFNIGGTRNVLEACRIHDVKKIIFPSSSEVYGEPSKLPIKETDTAMPITTYGLSKLAAEEYVKSYAKTYGIKYMIFRLFNIYGIRQSTRFVIPEFVHLALKNKQITIHGDGSQIRAFCNIKDVLHAFSLVLSNENNEIFNIGNDSEPDRKSTRLNSSHIQKSRMPSSA